MARPAAGTGRQAQVAGLLVAALAGACAKSEPPPGGPPRPTPAAILRVQPESGAIVPDWKDDAVVEFDEVIDEMPSSGGSKESITGLAAHVILSPVAGEVRVSWHRSAIHVKPAEGWKPNRVYHLELLPGILDLRRNVTKAGTVVVFATGDRAATAAITGTALLWVEQHALAHAVIRAAPLPDTVAYVTMADSAGGFSLGAIPPGRYLVWAIQDQNNNRRADRREAFDTVTVTVDSSASAVVWAFVHDTVGPRVRSVDPIDSTAFRLAFTQALDPRHPLDTAKVHVFALPDTAPVAVQTFYTVAQYDSLQARARAAADSLRRLQDSAAHRDTAKARPARPPRGAERPPAGGGGRPQARDTGAARPDTTKLSRLLKQRPVPLERFVVRVAAPLVPGAKYLVRVRGAANLSGAVASTQGVLVVPVRKPPARDTTRAKPR